MNGLLTAEVTRLTAETPEHTNKIEVTFTSGTRQWEILWARVCTIFSGALFFPEIGDTVVVGLLDEDQQPVILGVLYPTRSSPQYTVNDENKNKSLVTYNRMAIRFDEQQKRITVETPGGNKVILSDDEKSVSLSDQNGNSVTLSPAGIDLQSSNNININAIGNLQLKATGNILVTASADISVTGLNVKEEGLISFHAKGAASVIIEASGETIVKGAMVLIN